PLTSAVAVRTSPANPGNGVTANFTEPSGLYTRAMPSPPAANTPGVGDGGGTGFDTVTVNVSEAERLPPSVTVRVMTAVPVCPAAGVTIKVRLVPAPLMV